MYGEEPLASNPFSTEAFKVSGRVPCFLVYRILLSCVGWNVPFPSYCLSIDEQLLKWLGRMARLKRDREENQISDPRPVAFSFLANWSNNVDPEPTPDPFMFLSLYDRTFFQNLALGDQKRSALEDLAQLHSKAHHIHRDWVFDGCYKHGLWMYLLRHDTINNPQIRCGECSRFRRNSIGAISHQTANPIILHSTKRRFGWPWRGWLRSYMRLYK